jgi:hypothetical protein
MSHTLTRATRRVAVVAGTLALAASGLLVAAQGPASAQSTVTLDHFLCYRSTYNGPKAPPGIRLVNLIQPSGFVPTFGAADYHCNPANKSIPGALFKAKNPLAHLLCYRIASPFKPVVVTLKNQFGTSVMKTGTTPLQLCLPTWKSNIAPPGMTPNQPPGLDHLTCYAITPLSATSYGFHTANVKAEDEFSAPKYVALKLSQANQVCVPTVKILPSGFVYKTQGADDPSLVCFPTSPTPIWKVVYDQNQFGTSTVVPTKVHEEFCAPSTVSNQGVAP